MAELIKNEKYNVTGMSCAACSAHVEKAVSGMDGVSNVSVNLLTGSMTLDRDAAVSPADVCSAVKTPDMALSLFPAGQIPRHQIKPVIQKLLKILRRQR